MLEVWVCEDFKLMEASHLHLISTTAHLKKTRGTVRNPGPSLQ